MIHRLMLLALFATVAHAGEIRLAGVEPGRLESASFVVEGAGGVAVSAVGVRQRFSDDMHADAWIVDDAGRLVWSLGTTSWTMGGEHRFLVEADERIHLPAGSYTAYLFPGGYRWTSDRPFRELGRVFNDVADMLRSNDRDRGPQWFAERCRFHLAGGLRVVDAAADPDGALVSLRPVPDASVRERLIRVTRATGLEVLVVGEADREAERLWDLGWIEHAATGEPVWMMQVERCTHAGGSERNVRWSGRVDLQPGLYRLVYATDATHSWSGWNEAPPIEPRYWGLQATAVDPGAVEIAGDDCDVLAGSDVVASWLRVGDGADLGADLDLDAPATLHVHALGEMSLDSVWDGGRILDRDDGSTVWAMDWSNTSHGGGVTKNRVFDGEVSLPAGRYRIVYATDDSHSFSGWNGPRPDEAFRYGMVVRRGSP